LPNNTKHYPLTIDRVVEIKKLNKQGIAVEELQAVEVVVGKPKEVEPSFVDVVGQISLRTLEKNDRRRRDQQRNNNDRRPNFNDRNNDRSNDRSQDRNNNNRSAGPNNRPAMNNGPRPNNNNGPRPNQGGNGPRPNNNGPRPNQGPSRPNPGASNTPSNNESAN